MIQLAGMLLSAFLMLGNPPAGENTENVHGLAAAGSARTPQQDQSAVNIFAASLTRYYVGVVNNGPQWTEQVDEVTKQNRAYLADLVTAGKLVGAGQVTDSKEVRWVLFFKGESVDEAKTIIDEAPAVKAGRFVGAVRPAWGTKGMGSKLQGEGKAKAKAMASGATMTHYAVVFKKGSKWSAEESESTRNMLQKQIANIVKMHQSGTLKFYAAFDDQGEVRGFGVLQASSMEAAKKLMKSDPAVKAKYFTPEFYTFEVAEGVLP